MKFKSLCAAALAVMGVSATLAGPVAHAATEMTSNGNVEVVEGKAGGTDQGTIDPEKPEEVLPENPDVETNPEKGSLVIEKVSHMNFGEIETAANIVTKDAEAITFSDGKVRGTLIQWADVRAGGTYGYTVQAKMTQQFKNAADEELTGATIDFSNPYMAAEAGNTNLGPATIAGGKLSKDGEAITIVDAKKATEEGKGRWVMEFGSTDGVGGDDTTGESVKLTVPSATASNMALGDYVANVQWSIVAAP